MAPASYAAIPAGRSNERTSPDGVKGGRRASEVLPYVEPPQLHIEDGLSSLMTQACPPALVPLPGAFYNRRFPLLNEGPAKYEVERVLPIRRSAPFFAEFECRDTELSRPASR